MSNKSFRTFFGNILFKETALGVLPNVMGSFTDLIQDEVYDNQGQEGFFYIVNKTNVVNGINIGIIFHIEDDGDEEGNLGTKELLEYTLSNAFHGDTYFIEIKEALTFKVTASDFN